VREGAGFAFLQLRLLHGLTTPNGIPWRAVPPNFPVVMVRVFMINACGVRSCLSSSKVAVWPDHSE
jgi:hypothetical protein